MKIRIAAMLAVVLAAGPVVAAAQNGYGPPPPPPPPGTQWTPPPGFGNPWDRSEWNRGRNIGSILPSNGTMNRGQRMVSDSGRYQFQFQNDGNLVLTDRRGHVVMWASNTQNSPAVQLIMQSDGNLVLYSPDRRVIWASNTRGRAVGYRLSLRMQDDGNLVIYGRGHRPVWSTGTYRGY